MLRFKLFKGAALLVIAFGVLSSYLGVALIKSRVVAEAQNSVRLDLGSAWFIYDQQLREIETVLHLVATKQALLTMFAEERWGEAEDREEIRNRLEKLRIGFELDFLTVTGADGRVLLRASPPYGAGQYCPQDSVITRALSGQPAAGTTLLSAGQLEAEAEGLAERAYLPLEETPKARPTARQAESRGMLMLAAYPVEKNGEVVGAIYGGILLNRNEKIITRIEDVVYKQDLYENVPRGTVTIFLWDSRVATTVRRRNGNRAYGTRVSKEVAERVLDNGEPWADRAFVVKDWYRTAYDPIRSLDGETIGMLYVGTLERPFTDMSRNIVLRYAGLSGAVLVVALVLAFLMAGRIAAPLHRLSEAAREMRRGHFPGAVPVNHAACRETAGLIQAFNEMVGALNDRECQLREANRSLTVANGNYMETVQFVSHELKRPVASMMNYVYMLKQHLLGPLTEKQEKAVGVLDGNLRSLSEMIRHYLNLARIENNELSPIRSRNHLVQDIFKPVLESLEPEASEHGMGFDIDISPELVVYSDRNMTREIAENLLSNAVKYGRSTTRVTVSARADGTLVRCAVRNLGVGISPERLPRMFEKFTHLEDGQGEHRMRGTGLGLFITKQIVEAHGGTIEVDSVPGEWAEFRFTLPLWSETATGEKRASGPESKGDGS